MKRTITIILCSVAAVSGAVAPVASASSGSAGGGAQTMRVCGYGC